METNISQTYIIPNSKLSNLMTDSFFINLLFTLFLI